MLTAMMTGILMLLAGLLAACGAVKGTPGDASPDTAADMAGPACDVTKPFGQAIEVPGLHDPLANDVHATLTDDELTVYFGTNRMDHSGIMHIFSSTRLTRDAGFPMPMLVGPTFSDQGESHPSISPDGNALYFDSSRVIAGSNLFMSTRSNAGVVFPMPMKITGDFLIDPGITIDGNALYSANLSSGLIVRMPRAGTTFGGQETVALPTQFSVVSPVTRDELTLYFSLGDTTGNDIYVAKRGSTSAAWVASEVTELKISASLAEPSWISPDGCRLYLTYRQGNGNSIIYIATRPK
jgi:WD40-like Beta Propeller Repeat